MSSPTNSVLAAAVVGVTVAVLGVGPARAEEFPAPVDRWVTPPADASFSSHGGEAGPETYGPNQTVLTIHASSIAPVYPDTTWNVTIGSWGWQKYRTGGSTAFAASLDLPEGSEIATLELDGCDSSVSAGVSLELWTCGIGSWCTVAAGPATGTTSAQGCTWWQTVLPSTVGVDNLWNSYSVRVLVGGTDTNTTFHAVRVYYRLRVSPAPAAATFSDVPVGYWAFQHVEALAASNITAGCGGGSFCPEAPLTRAQMAVFLAKALGLHWAP